MFLINVINKYATNSQKEQTNSNIFGNYSIQMSIKKNVYIQTTLKNFEFHQTLTTARPNNNTLKTTCNQTSLFTLLIGAIYYET